MATTDIETKITKLLAMAEGTTNKHEADAFTAQAEKLMVKHNVDLATLEASKPGTTKQEIVIERIPVPDGHGYAAALANIAYNTAPSFSVRILQSAMRKNGKLIWFIGHRSDVDDAIRLFNSLATQAIPQAKMWWKTEGKPAHPYASDNDAYLARREFIFAFGRGAGSRLRETRNTVVAEAGAGTELVLVDRARAVDSWIDSNVQVGKGRETNRRTGGEAARGAGYASGRNAVTQKPLGR